MLSALVEMDIETDVKVNALVKLGTIKVHETENEETVKKCLKCFDDVCQVPFAYTTPRFFSILYDPFFAPQISDA